jgi:predicted metal-dependent enzyme (double-stranded beta helix superfamily)
MYAPSDLVRDMRKITSRTDDPAEILRRLRDPASRLALSRQWLERRFYGLNEAQGFDIYPLHEEADHTLSVVVASLLPGHSLPPHDHRTWALQVGIEGYDTNIDWRRTDDGSRPGYAVIEEAGRTIFGPGEVVSFMPNDIHSVVNESDQLCLSLNLYGLSYGYTHSRRFDPAARTEGPLIASAGD